MAIQTKVIQNTLQRATHVLFQTQRPTGDWDSPADMGPLCTTQTILALHYVSQLTDEEKSQALKWLKSQQNPDGSYNIHLFAREGDTPTTAGAWGAMRVCGAPTNDPNVTLAWNYIQQHGGIESVITALDYGDPTALYLAMAGFLDSHQIKKLPIFYVFSPWLMKQLEKRVHAGILMMLSQIGVVVRRLRGDYGVDGNELSWIERKEVQKVKELLIEFQNGDGSWNSITMQTTVAMAALQAMSVPQTDPVFQNALKWVKAQKIQDEQGLRFIPFMTGVWSTAFNVRALLIAGVSREHPTITRAIDWMIDCQCTRPMPVADNRKRNAVLTGGWPFEKPNDRMPDSDDTAVVLSALAMALKPGKNGDKLSDERAARTKKSLEDGFAWLFDMQNPDGGWQAYVWNLGQKKPGPFMMRPVAVPSDSYIEMAKVLLHPPAELGDPATEDVTGRALHAMGHFGYNASNEIAENAIEFLRYQQCSTGAFWGRWAAPYLPSTAFVLVGLASIKADMSQDWIQDAIRWTIQHQNADGGWGEDYMAYREPSQAGIGHSMPTLTGLVLYGLIEAGQAKHPAVEKGIQYLISRQRADGTWPNNAYLHSYIDPDLLFDYIEAPRFYTVIALGSYLNAIQEPSITPVPDESPTAPRWNDTFMEKRRLRGDPLADEIVSQIFNDPNLGNDPHQRIGKVNSLYQLMIKSDDPVPADLPPLAKEYFSTPSPLPEWADFEKIKRAQILFTKFGWEVAIGLFCSALPQAYCAAKGTHALFQTTSMTGGNVVRRVFETAQFIFDTMDIGGLGPSGRGIRAAQKVRLMHATIRKLLTSNPQKPWDEAFYGVPINQEDMAGTLMTFSCIIVDALRRIHVDVDEQAGEDWLHTWKAIGHVMGVEPKMLPQNFADGEALMDSIRRRQWAKNEDGKKLALALVQMMQAYFPGKFMDNMPVSLMRYLAGDYCGDLLQLPSSDWTKHLVGAGTILEDLLRRGKHGTSRAAIIDYATHLLMEGVVKAKRGGKDAQFRIPESLTHSLGPNT